MPTADTRYFFLPAFRVIASAANASGTLGVCNIEDPIYYGVYDEESHSNSIPSAYNRVYFGQIPTTNDTNNIYNTEIYHTSALGEPIYWRVLNTHANDINSTPALFMLTEYIFTNGLKWDNTEPYSQNWTSDSTINTLLNDTENTGSVYNKCFQAQERNILMETYNGEITEYLGNNLSSSDKLVKK